MILQLRTLLALPPNKRVVFERYSDSAGTFITLDSANASVYKQLYRAAKAKLKLRIKATVTDVEPPTLQAPRDASVQLPPFQLPPMNYVPPVTRSNSGKSEMQVAVENVMATSDANPQQPAEEFAQDAYAQYVRSCMANQVRNLSMAPPPQLPPPQTEVPKAEKNAVENIPPLPKPSGEEQLKRSSTLLTKEPMIRLRAVDQDFPVPTAAFTVCCNNCELTIPAAHWHCSICHNGDYDLCQSCVNDGVHCGVEGHYLIKRLIEGGKVITSTTETVPKKTAAPKVEQPPAYSAVESEPESEPVLTRTCNCCVSGEFTRYCFLMKLFADLSKVFEETKFVTCKDCEDYDLCIPCHISLKHGHNPTHEFAPVDEEATLESKATLLLKPGRHANHHAICDGCNKVSISTLTKFHELTVNSTCTVFATSASDAQTGTIATTVSRMPRPPTRVTASLLCMSPCLSHVLANRCTMAFTAMALFALPRRISTGSSAIATSAQSAMIPTFVPAARLYQTTATIAPIP